MLANSVARVEQNTDPRTNAAIRRRAAQSIAYFSTRPGQIESRLRDLDAERDIERALARLSSGLTLWALITGITRKSRWLDLTLAVQGLYLQHSLQGRCPPLPILRKLGLRTRFEIDAERYALKALRGDFEGVAVAVDPDEYADLDSVRLGQSA